MRTVMININIPRIKQSCFNSNTISVAERQSVNRLITPLTPRIPAAIRRNGKPFIGNILGHLNLHAVNVALARIKDLAKTHINRLRISLRRTKQEQNRRTNNGNNHQGVNNKVFHNHLPFLTKNKHCGKQYHNTRQSPENRHKIRIHKTPLITFDIRNIRNIMKLVKRFIIKNNKKSIIISLNGY